MQADLKRYLADKGEAALKILDERPDNQFETREIAAIRELALAIRAIGEDKVQDEAYERSHPG